MNSAGKVLIVFLVVTATLLVSLTAISLFFFQKETERRKLAEVTLEEYQVEKVKVEEELEELKKQNFLLQEKNKESEARVNDLSDELELESGLREEMKLETVSLEEKLQGLKKEKEVSVQEIQKKEELYEEMAENLSTSEQKIKELESQLKAEVERSQKLGQLYEKKQQEEAEAVAKEKKSKEALSNNTNSGIELEEIVIAPRRPKIREVAKESIFEETAVFALESALNGRILSVDVETEFIIVSLGKSDGLAVGNILSIYRNENYVGDVKVTRLQSEMSAADLIQPLSIGNVQKNDQVKVK